MTVIAAIREQAAKEQTKSFEVYEVTAYTTGDDFTPSHGITASGKRVRRGFCACSPELPFGTKIYILELDRTFICEDRGGRIKGKRIDIYMTSRSKALQFGRQRMKVQIISE